MKWSPQQNEALSKAASWLRIKSGPVFYLAGYAGTGKSTETFDEFDAGRIEKPL